MLQLIVRGGGSIVASLILSALFAGVALGGEPSGVAADADLDLTVEIVGDDLLGVDVDLAVDAVVDLGHADDPLVRVDGDTRVDLVADLSHRDDQPVTAADADAASLAVVGDPALDVGILIGWIGGPFDGPRAGSHSQVPIDLAVVDAEHNLVHALVGATSENEAFVGDVLLAEIGADACVEAIIGPGALLGCDAPRTTAPDGGDGGEHPGGGDPIGPVGASGEAPGAGSLPDASPGGPGGATGALPDTAVSPVTGGWLGIIGALLAILAGAWTVRRRGIGR